jgi:hypothetical protein
MAIKKIVSKPKQKTTSKANSKRIKHQKDIVMRKVGLTVKEHGRAVKLYKKFYKNGVTVANALALSLPADYANMKKDINIAGLTANRNGQLIFTVQASRRYLDNKYGRKKSKVATKHYVHVEFDKEALDRAILKKMQPLDILMNTPFKYQCSCGKHTFWYRYVWTVLGASIGLQQKIFPSVRNKMLEGLLCKHGIRAMLYARSKRFIPEFERYLDARERRIQFRTKNPFFID